MKTLAMLPASDGPCGSPYFPVAPCSRIAFVSRGGDIGSDRMRTPTAR